ncbi:hypothetical protein PR202_ga01948 [Eleusine coracana subsp. coracana]|uniref:Leucine-rich repeat-containing N-terminal plant-type domain-containing protein n=1 Tax=Eleusine coracana subsp. coracana TaxID=191504 RepID=A0AAV5BKE6_ELECO|nr:hypothetical protein QOZ80_2AG0137040 [Eleusine coracana subsp. coracana]GJM85495.1 hypothetical protein PR202_ga01261 [Eleusine coracana subsp. coracana]GJM86123.1 hypothetical protein PR202_ga01948 [Eleusine coracana subsp. coracana]
MLMTTSPLITLLLLLSCGIGDAHGLMVRGNSSDMLSLLDFKKSVTSDPNGALSSWNTSTPFCRWNGIMCSRKHPGRVTKLHLGGHGLSGPVSPSLSNLTLIKEINLSSNALSGQLPPLNHLHKLEVLDLGNNSLHDTIPDALTNCSSLRILDLYRNLIFGEIPPQVSMLSVLSVLRLSLNNITGIIPPSISNLTSVQKISLSWNQLTGSIPDGLGKLSNLSVLTLGENGLSGGIPQSLSNLSSLRILGLELTVLGGALPPNFGNTLPRLQWLYLDSSMFHGYIPASLGNASDLERIKPLETRECVDNS